MNQKNGDILSGAAVFFYIWCRFRARRQIWLRMAVFVFVFVFVLYYSSSGSPTTSL